MKSKRRKNTQNRIKINPKTVFVVCVVLCLLLIFVSYRFRDKIAPVKTFTGNVFAPMQRGICTVGQAISDRLKQSRDIEELIAENDSLKAQLEEIRRENQVLTQEKYELNWYRDLYELDKEYTDYSKVAAKVISREPSGYSNFFVIDKGTQDGICENMNVIAGNGLVGIIVETGKNWARVKSIIDDSSNVSGMFLKTSDTCMVSGNIELLDKGYIDVSMINPQAEIYDNYEVVTSYISSKYLPGILIGYVSNITNDISTMTQKAYLTPVVDFRHLEAVLVITELKETYEGLDEVTYGDN